MSTNTNVTRRRILPTRNRNRSRLVDGDTGQGLETLASDVTVSVPVLSQLIGRHDPLLNSEQCHVQARDRRASATGLGVIDRLLAEPEVNEIMINGVGHIWVERGGRLVPVDHRMTANGLSLIIERMLSPLGLRLDRLNPIVDARLPDGSRVNVVGSQLAIDGPLVSIRRFAPKLLPVEAFGPPVLAGILGRLVGARKSMLVVGPTSSGKTTLLNSLSRFVDDHERVVTIEDTAELQFSGDHVVRLESRRANSEGVGEVSLRRLVTTALRLRPDRIVVGEVRGAEAFDLLLALTSGHTGSFCTCHARDAASGLRRLEMLASLADANLSPALLGDYVNGAIDVVVTVDRVGGRRLVTAVDEVTVTNLSDGRRLRRVWSVDTHAGAEEVNDAAAGEHRGAADADADAERGAIQ